MSEISFYDVLKSAGFAQPQETHRQWRKAYPAIITESVFDRREERDHNRAARHCAGLAKHREALDRR